MLTLGTIRHWDNIIIKFIIFQVQRRRRKQRGQGTLAHLPAFCKKPEFPPEHRLTTGKGRGEHSRLAPISQSHNPPRRAWIGHLLPRVWPHKNHLSSPAMVLSFKYRQGQFGPWSLHRGHWLSISDWNQVRH